MYRVLSAKYGWTPQQIADMTPAQQLMYCDAESRDGDIITFNTMREAQEFLNAHGRQ